ncbi:beta-1,4 N-acetylgalactosaminyltransferase 1-like isoform X3 [Pimephales promelas]|uniref:beta-1,4 N-acetylgalactosaminyltransferase 1-like isoform X3 n=1 Tax=Pimephales promelas TaxID=90988 RepID=UPI0019556D54|nr:beta-1,4 N-acetylgalactosaminyltransferase 1-like isoform X3 [Pimephales promelas]KAG1967382.1 beta-1,4 N-acetylgalactosaminyltransferase [Pimephales promelas]
MTCMHTIRRKFFLIGVTLIIFLVLLKVMKSISDPSSASLGQDTVSSITEHHHSFGPLRRPNVTCEGAELAKQFAPEDKLDDIIERRTHEFNQHQLRMKTNEEIIIATANSPLQYPTSFTVAPLQKSLIPGLALQTQGRCETTIKREAYKVSLSVKSGVLSVEKVLDGQQVDGRGQSELNISSSSLAQLNDLLSRVTYTSTIYRVKAEDLVHFSYDDHKAIFPLMIRRPSVPVLLDPGKDINSQVTIITKTFLRYKELNTLIQSIRKFYPNIKIIVADDSLKPEHVSGNNIEHYIMPPAQGWFAGRNLALSQLTTKYFLWVDDDFLFLKETRIESFVEIMEAVPELDVLGGDVSDDQFHFTLEYDEGDEEGGCLKRIKGGFHQRLSGYDRCVLVDGVINYFLARTEAIRRIGFDPLLKRVGHTEFFIDALGKLLVASCKGLSIGHQTHRAQTEYDSYRTQGKLEEKRKLAHHFFKNYLNYIKY